MPNSVIHLYANTRRAVGVINALRRGAPDSHIVVFSAPEMFDEPPYVHRIRQAADAVSADYYTIPAPFLSPRPDMILCSNWRQKIEKRVIDATPYGAFCIHDSLLPRWRGHSPLVHAIMEGDRVTGATLFRMTDMVDAGPILSQRTVVIDQSDSIASVMPRVDMVYYELTLMLACAFAEGRTLSEYPQDETGATVAERIDYSEDGLRIDWSWPHQRIVNFVRALAYPYPGARA